MAKGDPNALRIAALMIFTSLQSFNVAKLPDADKAWYYPRTVNPSMREIPMADAQQSELGDFLRSRREKLSPKTIGLSNVRRRRTPGLRREEVAELAGIGVDWYIRLEQGRAVSPSVTTVDALARALRLSKAEHSHLRALTRKRRTPCIFARERSGNNPTADRWSEAARLCHRPALGYSGVEQGRQRYFRVRSPDLCPDQSAHPAPV